MTTPAARPAPVPLERRLERAKRQCEILEQLLEERTRVLYLARERARATAASLASVLDSVSSVILIADTDGVITSIGGATTELTGFDLEDLRGLSLGHVLDAAPTAGSAAGPGAPSGPGGAAAVPGPRTPDLPVAPGVWPATDMSLRTASGGRIPVLVAVSQLTDQDGTPRGVVCTATDVTERRRLELELANAQRLESVGQLAAGVSHEINNPIQYVGDSLAFLTDVVHDLLELHELYARLRAALPAGAAPAVLLEAIERREREVDVDLVRREAPRAVARSVEGVERVASIVQAMRRFSHPGSEAMAPLAVNEVVETVLTLARHEYRDIAHVRTDLSDVPEVLGDRGDLGQVLLSLVVNAIHAIEDRSRDAYGPGARGEITVTTATADGGVLISVADTGGGVPEDIRDRVFEPFFTTKEPGRGTGQGLALARSLVVGRHGGRIDFTVDEGVGTTFRVWLPGRDAA